MYKLEFLPVARQDMIEIVQYISRTLENPGAADQIALALIAAAEQTAEFPYANPAHMPIRPLLHEYRKVLVKNYRMFYWVEEQEKTVVVARVVYAKRNVERLLK